MQTDYHYLAMRISEAFPGSQLCPLSEEQIVALQSNYENLPIDYLAFLTSVGWGNIGECRLMLYSGPVSAGEILDAYSFPALNQVMLIGDDFNGGHIGYDTSTTPWVFIEFDHVSPHVQDASSSISLIAYIETLIASEQTEA